MRNTTDSFSFILKPSTTPNGGVGVFTLHDIAKDTYMELFLEDFKEEIYAEKDIPEELRGYCLRQRNGEILCPKYFNRMDIGNYINHSENSNMRYEKGKGYFAKMDIKAGEELFANYRELGEPQDEWASYYR